MMRLVPLRYRQSRTRGATTSAFSGGRHPARPFSLALSARLPASPGAQLSRARRRPHVPPQRITRWLVSSTRRGFPCRAASRARSSASPPPPLASPRLRLSTSWRCVKHVNSRRGVRRTKSFFFFPEPPGGLAALSGVGGGCAGNEERGWLARVGRVLVIRRRGARGGGGVGARRSGASAREVHPSDPPLRGLDSSSRGLLRF